MTKLEHADDLIPLVRNLVEALADQQAVPDAWWQPVLAGICKMIEGNNAAYNYCVERKAAQQEEIEALLRRVVEVEKRAVDVLTRAEAALRKYEDLA